VFYFNDILTIFSNKNLFFKHVTHTFRFFAEICIFTYTQLSNLTVYRAGQSTQLSICVCIFLFCLRHVTGRVGKCCPLTRLCETLTVRDYVCLTIIVESPSRFTFSSHYKRIIYDVYVNAKRERKISVNRTFIVISRDKDRRIYSRRDGS